MTDKSEMPERIWATAPYIGEYLADPPVGPIDRMYLTEYIRAALSQPMCAAVKPLEWEREEDWRYIGRPPVKLGGYCCWVMLNNGEWRHRGRPERYDTLEAAKAAANTHYTRRITEALDMKAEAEVRVTVCDEILEHVQDDDRGVTIVDADIIEAIREGEE